MGKKLLRIVIHPERVIGRRQSTIKNDWTLKSKVIVKKSKEQQKIS